MGILDTPVLTLAQKQAATKTQLRAVARGMRDTLAKQYGTGFDLVWNNPMGLTPQEALNALGTDAGQLLTFAETLKATINTLAPGTITQAAPHNVTVNQDGTATVGT